MKNKLFALFLSCSVIIQTALAPLGVNAYGAQKAALFTEAFPGDVGTDFMQYGENKAENDYFTGGFLVEGTSTPWRDNRFEIIEAGEEHAIKRSYDTGILSNVPQRPTRNLKNPITLNPAEPTVYFLKWKQYLGENDGFDPMKIPASGSAVSFDALMLDLGMRAGAGFTADSDGKIVPFISYYTGDSNIAYGTEEINPGIWYNMILKIEANAASPDRMSLAIYPETEEFDGEYLLTKEYTSSISYNKVSYHFRASQAKEQKADMAISGAVCEAYDMREAAAEKLVGKAKESVYSNSDTAAEDLRSAKDAADALEEGILKTLLSCETAELEARNSIFLKLNSFTDTLDLTAYEDACSVAELSSEQYKEEYRKIVGEYTYLYDIVSQITQAQTTEEVGAVDLSTVTDDSLKNKLSKLASERTAVILTEAAENDRTKEKLDAAVQAVAVLAEGTLKSQLTERLNSLMAEIAGTYAEQYLKKAEESKKLPDAEQSKLWIDSVTDTVLRNTLTDRYIRLMEYIDSIVPEAGSIKIKGEPKLGCSLRADPVYPVNECENDGEPIIKWYRDNALIAVAADYTVASEDLGKILKVEITPVNTAGKSGKAVFEEISVPRDIAVCYEDFAYEPGTPVKNIPELNSRDALKGFAGGWLVGSRADTAAGNPIENDAVTVTDRNTVSIPGNSTNYYMRELQQPIKADGEDCYYISWVMKGFIPATVGTQSQKLEFGTADGESSPVMVGMIHQNGTDKLIPFIKVNNLGIVYASESIAENKLYRFTAKIQMTDDKDLIALKAYPSGETAKSKWDVSISAALSPEVMDRLSFVCNYADVSGTVEYGDLTVQRYSEGDMALFEDISAELSKAEEEYSEQRLAAAGERLGSLIEGICKKELEERIRDLESKLEKEKSTAAEIEKILSGLEGTPVTDSTYEGIISQCNSASELIKLLYSEASKNNYLLRLDKIYSKLYYAEITKNGITDDFSVYEDGRPLSEDWFSDSNLTQSADEVKAANGTVKPEEIDIFRKIPTAELNLYTWYMEVCYSSSNAEFQIGNTNIKLLDNKITCIQNGNAVCVKEFKTNGILIFEADNGGIFIRNSEDELYVEWTQGQINKFGIMKGCAVNKIICQSVRKEIADDIKSGVSAAQSLQYGDILLAQSRIDCLPESVIKSVYSEKCRYLLEENKKTVPKITSVSVSGSEYPGGVLKMSYIMEDRGQNKGEPEIKWTYAGGTATGTDSFKIPSGTTGTITVSVTPVNIFGIKGEPYTRSVNIKRTGTSGGGGGGGSISAPVKNPPIENNADTAPEYIFLDITNHWAKASIEGLYKRGLVKGIENEFFYPDKSVTRAEFAQMISNITGGGNDDSVYFTDVYEGDWYFKAVRNAASCGIMIGNERKFNPNEEITREEIATAAYKLFKYLNCSSEIGEAAEFADKSDISPWAAEFVNSCSSIRLMSGMENNCFMPKKSATRAEAAIIICRILNCN